MGMCACVCVCVGGGWGGGEGGSTRGANVSTDNHSTNVAVPNIMVEYISTLATVIHVHHEHHIRSTCNRCDNKSIDLRCLYTYYSTNYDMMWPTQYALSDDINVDSM